MNCFIVLFSALYNTDCFKAADVDKQEYNSVDAIQWISYETEFNAAEIFNLTLQKIVSLFSSIQFRFCSHLIVSVQLKLLY